MLMAATGQPQYVIERDTDRDIYFTPQQGVEYGLIDQVLKANEEKYVKQLESNGR